jgi:signal recognition particle subunit SRP72
MAAGDISQHGSNLSHLYGELNRLGLNGEYEKATKICNKILAEVPDDEKVVQCKAVCQIQLGKFEEALQLLQSKNQTKLLFEKAYCEYRLNRLDEATRTLKSIPEHSPREKELLAQVCYREERFSECINLYRQLIKSTQDEYEDERRTNLSAAIASVRMWDKKEVSGTDVAANTYEQCYNDACSLLGEESYEEALHELERAKEMCSAAFGEDEEEMASEIATIQVQLAYVLQKIGRVDEALKIYNSVTKQKSADAAVVAIASNNIVTLNKDQNVFDSKKKIKFAMADNIKQKLTLKQRRSIAVNHCLLLLYTNQIDQCVAVCSQLKKAAPDDLKLLLIETAAYVQGKDYNKAVALLEQKSASNFTLNLALVQLHLLQSQYAKACQVLKSNEPENLFRLGVIGLLMSLYLGQDNHPAATAFITEAIDWYRKSNAKAAVLEQLMKVSINFQLSQQHPEAAVKTMEELRKKHPDDLKLLARLISAYSKFDSKKAQLLSRELPKPANMLQDIDVDSLESMSALTNTRALKKPTAKTELSPKAGSGGAVGSAEKRKKKKKKKKILPKNFDPSVAPDPERWLPLQERSTYRGRRKKNKRDGVGKGTQGAVAANVANELDVSKKAAASPDASSPTAGGAVPKQQSQQQQKQQQKKKKKGGNKW